MKVQSEQDTGCQYGTYKVCNQGPTGMGAGGLGLWSTGVDLVDRGSFSGRGTRVERVERARHRSRPWKG